ncbi:MAG TPA: FAD-dependent oxidoreductase, partial [Thermoanaerobaculia bacterium]|nr:FAD-dependent oxidoreductase [Thermoanaerobaculia bacterium]
GPTVLTYYYALCDHDPRVARERLLSLNRDQWAEVVLSDLERAHPEIRTLTQRLDVMRWGHAMIRPHPGFIASEARRRAQEPLRNIHFANADLSGVALFEEALYHGVRAAEEVLKAVGRELISFR